MFFCLRHEGAEPETNVGNVIVVLNTFKSKILKIQVRGAGAAVSFHEYRFPLYIN